jgi:hypothetical protein
MADDASRRAAGLGNRVAWMAAFLRPSGARFSLVAYRWYRAATFLAATPARLEALNHRLMAQRTFGARDGVPRTGSGKPEALNHRLMAQRTSCARDGVRRSGSGEARGAQPRLMAQRTSGARDGRATFRFQDARQSPRTTGDWPRAPPRSEAGHAEGVEAISRWSSASGHAGVIAHHEAARTPPDPIPPKPPRPGGAQVPRRPLLILNEARPRRHRPRINIR